jgi:hypothetical protein
MFRKSICLVSFVLVLGLVGDVHAATVNWTDAGPDHLWSTLTNWDTGTLPTSVDKVRIGILPGPTIANEGAVADAVHVGHGGTAGALTVDGGTFTTTGWLQLARNAGSEGTLNMKSGTITTGGQLMGHQGSCTLNMTGGTITVEADLKIPGKAEGTGHVNLYGGIITANNIEMREEAGSVGTMDVRAGTLIIDGDNLSLVQGYIDNGWITAYGGSNGNGTLQLDYDVTNKGQTTLKAVHFLNPNPADGSLVSPGEKELSWTLPDPCVPGQPVLVDVYFTDDLESLQMFTDPAAIQVVSKQNVNSVVVQTQLKTRYYWAVDTYIGDPNDPVFGPIFSFFADNAPPKVYAGADVVTWLEEGIRIGNLDATVIDDGFVSPYTVQWTVVSEPNDPNSPDAVITDPSVENTSITLSALGEYVLQLEAFDGEYTGSDTVTINVYNDSVEATWSLPDYEPLVGDLNWDCKVDEADLALLEENWLQDNSLTDEWFLMD